MIAQVHTGIVQPKSKIATQGTTSQCHIHVLFPPLSVIIGEIQIVNCHIHWNGSWNENDDKATVVYLLTVHITHTLYTALLQLHLNTPQHTPHAHLNTPQHTHLNTPQHAHLNTLQHTSTHLNTDTSTHLNTPQHRHLNTPQQTHSSTNTHLHTHTAPQTHTSTHTLHPTTQIHLTTEVSPHLPP